MELTMVTMQKIIHGDCLEVLKKGTSDSIDCVVTDPPYGYSFMGNDMTENKIGPFFFFPQTKIVSMTQLNDCLGCTKWTSVYMTYEQVKDYTYLLPPANGLATSVNGMEIIIYGYGM